jgi:hypothetical protein
MNAPSDSTSEPPFHRNRMGSECFMKDYLRGTTHLFCALSTNFLLDAKLLCCNYDFCFQRQINRKDLFDSDSGVISIQKVLTCPLRCLSWSGEMFSGYTYQLKLAGFQFAPYCHLIG